MKNLAEDLALELLEIKTAFFITKMYNQDKLTLKYSHEELDFFAKELAKEDNLQDENNPQYDEFSIFQSGYYAAQLNEFNKRKVCGN